MAASAATPVSWTPKSLLAWCESYFRERDIASPRLDAELLLAHVLGCTRIDLYLQFDRPILPRELEIFRPLVRRRAQHTPVAYLTGTCGFWSLELAVGPGCLIPRPDTETLVETALDALAALRREPHALPDATAAHPAALEAGAEAPAPSARALWILELGTGTGAVPLALCAESTGLRIVACELSAAALHYARRNRDVHAALLGPRDNRLHLLRGDRFAALRAGFAPDLILSNPPYVSRDELPELVPEVAAHEPSLALDGGTEGLDFYRYLLDDAAARQVQGGRVVLEMGFAQAPALERLVASHGALSLLEIRRDLAGRPRVVHVQHR